MSSIVSAHRAKERVSWSSSTPASCPGFRFDVAVRCSPQPSAAVSEIAREPSARAISLTEPPLEATNGRAVRNERFPRPLASVHFLRDGSAAAGSRESAGILQNLKDEFRISGAKALIGWETMGSRCFPVVLAVTLSACATPAFSRDLLAVDLTRAPVPVMISRVKREPRPGAAPVANEFTNATPATRPDTIFTYGQNYTLERSRFGASEQLFRRISNDTGWVQIGETVFSASDTSQLGGGGEMRRELSLQSAGRR